MIWKASLARVARAKATMKATSRTIDDDSVGRGHIAASTLGAPLPSWRDLSLPLSSSPPQCSSRAMRIRLAWLECATELSASVGVSAGWGSPIPQRFRRPWRRGRIHSEARPAQRSRALRRRFAANCHQRGLRNAEPSKGSAECDGAAGVAWRCCVWKVSLGSVGFRRITSAQDDCQKGCMGLDPVSVRGVATCSGSAGGGLSLCL